jgi:hypothetical protein
MRGWLYVLLCVLVPPAWGWLMHLVFGWVERRRPSGPGRDELPPIDYSI